MHTFTDALAIVLREEGGYVDDPRDPGGVTNLGVTEASWSHWIGHAATAIQMRGLTPVQVTPFYRAQYWDAVAGDKLPDSLALCVFDFAVNAGPGESVKTLQGIAGAPRDGKLGDDTLRALQAYLAGAGLVKLITRFGDARRNHYREQPQFLHFGRGWLARVQRIEKVALSWIG